MLDRVSVTFGIPVPAMSTLRQVLFTAMFAPAPDTVLPEDQPEPPGLPDAYLAALSALPVLTGLLLLLFG